MIEGKETLEVAWWLSIFPGLAILITVLAFTLLREALQEILNPKRGVEIIYGTGGHDLNPHGFTSTSPSSQRIFQFRSPGIKFNVFSIFFPLSR